MRIDVPGIASLIPTCYVEDPSRPKMDSMLVVLEEPFPSADVVAEKPSVRTMSIVSDRHFWACSPTGGLLATVECVPARFVPRCFLVNGQAIEMFEKLEALPPVLDVDTGELRIDSPVIDGVLRVNRPAPGRFPPVDRTLPSDGAMVEYAWVCVNAHELLRVARAMLDKGEGDDDVKIMIGVRGGEAIAHNERRVLLMCPDAVRDSVGLLCQCKSDFLTNADASRLYALHAARVRKACEIARAAGFLWQNDASPHAPLHVPEDRSTPRSHGTRHPHDLLRPLAPLVHEAVATTSDGRLASGAASAPAPGSDEDGSANIDGGERM